MRACIFQAFSLDKNFLLAYSLYYNTILCVNTFYYCTMSPAVSSQRQLICRIKSTYFILMHDFEYIQYLDSIRGTSDFCSQFSVPSSTLKLRPSHTSAALTSPLGVGIITSQASKESMYRHTTVCMDVLPMLERLCCGQALTDIKVHL